MILLKNVSKSYKKKIILNHVNYQFADTGFYCLYGPSGLGKTTLLNAIAHEINVHGTIETTAPFIYYNFANDHLFLNATVKENFKLFFSEEEYSVALEYLYRYEIDYLIHKKVKVLSSGENQKILLIIAFVKKAPIILLDEPFSNIDQESKRDWIEELKSISQSSCVIYTAHDQTEQSYSDILLTIENNQIIEVRKDTHNSLKKADKADFHSLSVRFGIRFLFYRFQWLKSIFFVLFTFLFFLVSLFSSLLLVTETDIFKNHLQANSNNVYNGVEDLGCSAIKYDLVKESLGIPGIYFHRIDLSTVFGWWDQEHQYEYITEICVTEKVLLNGKMHRLADDEIVVSDCFYDLMNLDTYPFFIGNSPVFPGVKEEDGTPRYKILVYETDYSDYYDEIVQLKEQSSLIPMNKIKEFMTRMEKFYANVYVSESGLKRFAISPDFRHLETSGMTLTRFDETGYFNPFKEPFEEDSIIMGNLYFKRYFDCPLNMTDQELEQLYQEKAGQYYEVTFENNQGKRIVKTLKLHYPLYKGGGRPSYPYDTFVDSTVYEELVEELSLNEVESLFNTKGEVLLYDLDDETIDWMVDHYDSFEILNQEEVYERIENYREQRPLFAMGLIISGCFILVFLLIDYVVCLRKDFKESLKLRYKGVSATSIRTIKISALILEVLFVLMIAVLLCYGTRIPIFRLFGIFR